MAEGGGEEQATGAHIDTHDVFISYASHNTTVANDVAAALEDQDLKCWIAPRDVTPGAHYASEIVHAIDSAKAVVLILSQNAAISPHVLREIERATSKRHPVVTLRVDQAPLPAEFEYFLNSSQWLDVSGGDIARFIPKLIAAVRVAIQAPVVTLEVAPTPRSPAPLPSVRPPKRTAIIVASLIGLLIAGLAVDRLWVSSRRSVWSSVPTATVPAPAPAAAAPTIPEKSVAVLRFVDLSEKKDQSYFADGLAEELIDRLTRIQGLRVPSRTSSFYFKDKVVPVSAIADALGLAYIVEGSVRRERNIVRVTAQLIRADSGNHVWSVTYERPLQDILKTEQAIAIAVAAALKVTVSDKTSYGGYATTSPEAFDLYLQAADQTQRSQSIDDLKLRLSKANQSVTLDPTFSDGWSEVAQLSADLAARQGDRDGRLAKMTSNALRRAIESDHVSAKILTQVGLAHLTFDLDVRKAISAFRRASELDPDGTQGLFAQGVISFLQGDRTRALTAFRKLVELNPYTEAAIYMETEALSFSGQWTDAEAAIKRDLALSPEDESSIGFAAYILTKTGKPQEALEMANKIEKSPELRSSVLPFIYEALDRKEDAAVALDDLIKRFGDRVPYSIAGVYAHRRDVDQAFTWLNRAYAARDIGIWEIRSDPLFEPLIPDARYTRLLQQLGLID